MKTVEENNIDVLTPYMTVSLLLREADVILLLPKTLHPYPR